MSAKTTIVVVCTQLASVSGCDGKAHRGEDYEGYRNFRPAHKSSLAGANIARKGHMNEKIPNGSTEKEKK